jgi:hypothetical protein
MEQRRIRVGVKTLSLLKESLNYLHVNELRKYCLKFCLCTKGKKPELASRIMHFVKNGEKVGAPNYSLIQSANKHRSRKFKPEKLILKGAYKNDLKTRMFFKNLIDKYFTDLGTDWLEERWMAGLLTHEEFMEMWEYLLRKPKGRALKEEWAVNFVKYYLKDEVSSKEIKKWWGAERHKHKKRVDEFFAK